MGVAALVSLLVAGSKALYSANITAFAVYSVARSSMMMVEIFRPSQNRDLRGVVSVLVSKVNFKRPTPENSVVIIEHWSLHDDDACA